MLIEKSKKILESWDFYSLQKEVVTFKQLNSNHFQSGFGLGFWGFGFALAVLVCLWAPWGSRVSCIHVFSPV